MLMNYVLIDYENVQPSSLAGLRDERFHVLLFVGERQNKLPYEFAAEVQKLGARAEYIKITGNGPNALDLHIAFHIGRLAETDPQAVFQIISKDTGFDPLIQHLRARKITAHRSSEISDNLMLNAKIPNTTAQRVNIVVTNLMQRGDSKPGTLETLTNTINSLFQKQLTKQELDTILTSLTTQGFIAINNSKISYSLSAKPELVCIA
jgi:PIN domain